MGIGTGIFLLAVGAILRFAVTTTTKGLKIQTVGDILMIAGALGILLSLVFWNSWGGFGGDRRQSRTTVIRDRDVVGEREMVRDREVL